MQYTNNGNISNSQDYYNAQWSYGYDTLNRLTSANSNGATYPHQCWLYDIFGNRYFELDMTASYVTCPASNAPAGSSFTPPVNAQYLWATYNSNNQVTKTSVNSAGSNYTYDLAGNVTNDGSDQYVYDPEGRICAVKTSVPSYTQYIYDAEGRRVAKGTISLTNQTAAFPLAGSNATPYCAAPTGSGFTLTNVYLRGTAGNQDTELDGSGKWQHTNIFGHDGLTATYWNNSNTPTLSYNFNDWLGTKRMQATSDSSSMLEQISRSYPYGNLLSTFGNGGDATEHHLTGKERDSESGNDYFGARYYASSTGRWLSPDWSAKASPVPYATFGNPQSLNLYSYMRNNPLSGADADGHCDFGCIFGIAMGIAQGVQRDGGVGAYLKNVGTGILKGAATTIGNAANIAASGGNPGVIASTITSPGPAALQPSNTTQAQASMVTQAVLPAAAGTAAGPLLGAAAGAGAEAESSVGVGTQLFRVFGNEATPFGNPNGAFFTTMDPSTAVPDFRTAAGLFPGNSGQFVMTGTLNDMTGVTSGTAAAGPGGVGGTIPEVIVPNAAQQVTPTSVSGANPPY